MRLGIISPLFFKMRGGAERFTAALAGAMLERGHEVVLFHSSDISGRPAYSLPNRVVVKGMLSYNNRSDLERVRNMVREADVDLICLMITGGILSIIPVLYDSGIPLLITERMAPIAIECRLLSRTERLINMGVADAIHLQSRRYLGSLPQSMHPRVAIIPNAVKMQKSTWSCVDASRKCLLCVARLDEYEKQISLLIAAFSLLANEFPNWDCRICGDGIAYSLYAAEIERLELSDRIKLVGRVEDVNTEYAHAHLFCLPSAFEGCPNALLEAQSYGVPAVGFASCPGVNDVIIDGENGFLAPEMTAESLAICLRLLMASQELRHIMGERSLRLLDRYEPQMIYGQWEGLFRSVAACKGYTRLDDYKNIPDIAFVKAVEDKLKYPLTDLKKEKHYGDIAKNTAKALRSTFLHRK